MSLVTPEIGLIIWQTIVFLIVLGILTSSVWRPIISALKKREFEIEDSLRAADHAKVEMEQLKSDNEYLLMEARYERDEILKEARQEAKQIIEYAKTHTADITTKMIEEARVSIEAERKAAIAHIKKLVAEISIEIAEKILRENLSDIQTQRDLVQKYIDEAQIN